jgi:AraC family transcriptional regulator of adaptative response/methylated-DNA-[protein]-cysteine methyltransferase
MLESMNDTERYEAILRRDRACDERFVYAVRTTGVYCRPSCASRRPLERNVCYFESGAAAQSAGFRACKRCGPGVAATIDERIVNACRLLDAAEEPLTLERLGELVGLSPTYLQRRFTREIGLSPHRYAQRGRERYVREGGHGKTISYAVVPSKLGCVLVAATQRGICRVDLAEGERELIARLHDAFRFATFVRAEDALESATSRIIAYLDADGPWPLLPVDVRATAFQLRVWEALRALAPGTTMHYGELARALGSPGAARAVARACASNPIALLIPCHRIVPQSGGVGGYRWGPERKRALLERERTG